MKNLMFKNMLGLFVIGFCSLTFAEIKEFDLAGVTKVEVKNGSGNINVVAVNTGKATVTVAKKQFGEHCQLTIDKRGTTLFVEVKKTGLLKENCEADFNISAPQNAALYFDSGSGDIKVTGTSGDISFNVGSGKVNIDAEIKKLEGKAGSGDIFISGLTVGGSIKTGSGKISLIYLAAPIGGELDIKTGNGSAEIVLPQTSKIRTLFTAGHGELTNELGDTPNSKFKISMVTGSGNLHIKKSN